MHERAGLIAVCFVALLPYSNGSEDLARPGRDLVLQVHLGLELDISIGRAQDYGHLGVIGFG